MSPRQVALVQGSWNDVLAVSETAAQLFYLRLFALDASLRKMFKGEMREQGRKLIAMMSVAVNGLARIETLVPVIEALGRRHAGYGVTDEHYATVAAALLWALEQGLGGRFTPEVKDAWTTAYGMLAKTMQDAAREQATAA
jgi:hemoglobin-like flavoprotein